MILFPLRSLAFSRLSLALLKRAKSREFFSQSSRKTFDIQTRRNGPRLQIDALGNVTTASSSIAAGMTAGTTTTKAMGQQDMSNAHYSSSSSYALISYLLPSGYPTTVAPSYSRYAFFSFLASTASSAGSILAMQSLLIAVGVGSNVAVPAAAALNWVLKDGLGQAGGVAFAAFIGNRFDADPKRWRLVSALVLDSATFLEVCSPLFGPKLFLPVAAIANFLKNVSWLTASATRAGIHQALAIRGNLADVTAKAASQSIAASTLGTAIGIGLSTSIVPATTSVLAIFAIASIMHLSGVAYSLRSVVIPTLSAARMDLAIDDWIRLTANNDIMERTTMMMTATHSPLVVSVKNPVEVAKRETFYPWESEGNSTFSSSSVSSSSSSSTTTLLLSQSFCRIQVSTGDIANIYNLRRCLEICTPNVSLPSSSSENIEGSLRANSYPPRYVVGFSSINESRRNSSDRSMTVQLHFAENADWNDILTGYIHAMRLRAEVDIIFNNSNTENIVISNKDQTNNNRSFLPWQEEVMIRSREWTVSHSQSIINALDASGWWVGTPLIDVSPELRLVISTS
jgi:hypothetical protein